MVRVNWLKFDEGNVEHIARHDITPDDVAEVCRGDPHELAAHSGRVLLVGPNAKGNLLSVVLAPLDEPGDYYVVTARSASKKERRAYREWIGGRTS